MIATSVSGGTTTSSLISEARRTHDRALRHDIQALRAFAVLAVVLFHLWPTRLTGGYVGVDVFFVISGYLITGQLVRRRARGRMGLGAFWAARARRLLPVSLFVLLVSVALTLLWAPDILKPQYLQSIIASALYVENWHLAANAVDYLAHDNSPPIAQHYWSLSVEEQFYLVWPLLILLATIRSGHNATAMRRRLLFLFMTVIVVSFAFSLWLTGTSAAYAYFATPGRFWEFGIGGVLALIPVVPWRAGIRTLVVLSGWAVLAVSVFAFTGDTPFPGWAAVLPTVGAGAVILAGPDMPRPLRWLVTRRLVQWLGDQSYGIYLWHWPLVIIAPTLLGRAPGLIESIALLALTIVCAASTRRLVEDPIRFSVRPWLARPSRVGIATIAAMGLVVSSALLPIWRIDANAKEKTDEIAAELADPSACRGASAFLVADCTNALDKSIPASQVVPALSGLLDDTGGAFSCYDQQPDGQPQECTFGSTRPDALRIALTGDSHAAMLIPAMRQIAEENNWTVTTLVGRGCIWLRTSDDPPCAERRTAVEDRLLHGGFDAIVEAAWNNPAQTSAERAETAERLVAAWGAARDAGITVVPVIDNPGVPQTSADCLAEAASFSLSTCAFPVDTTMVAEDPMRVAASMAGITAVDLSDAYCRDGSCPMVLGGIVVYRDLHHITATFSRSLSPYLAQRIADALG